MFTIFFYEVRLPLNPWFETKCSGSIRCLAIKGIDKTPKTYKSMSIYLDNTRMVTQNYNGSIFGEETKNDSHDVADILREEELNPSQTCVYFIRFLVINWSQNIP